MNRDFHNGFEKTAGLGLVKGLGKNIWGLGKKMFTSVSPKGVRTVSPMKAIGAGFGAMEVGNVMNKTNKTVKTITSGVPSMKNSNFFKMR